MIDRKIYYHILQTLRHLVKATHLVILKVVLTNLMEIQRKRHLKTVHISQSMILPWAVNYSVPAIPAAMTTSSAVMWAVVQNVYPPNLSQV